MPKCVEASKKQQLLQIHQQNHGSVTQRKHFCSETEQNHELFSTFSAVATLDLQISS